MRSLYDAALSPLTLPFTILLLLVVFYWFVVMIGAFDTDWAPDMDLPDEGVLSFLSGWLHLQDVPVTAVLSVLVLALWSGSMVLNYFLNPAGSIPVGLALLAANVCAGFFIAGLFGRALYRFMGKDREEIFTVLYKVGTVVTSQVNDTFGQVEVPTRGAPVTVHARTTDGRVLKKGDTVLIFDEDREKGVYFVEKYNQP